MNRVKYCLTGIVLASVLVSGVLLAREMMTPDEIFKADPSHGKIRGPSDADVTIIQYTHYLCPACARAERVLDEWMETYAGHVRIVFKHFPLGGHGWGYLAHQAAECANEQGRFWPYHEMLFAHQQDIMTSKKPVPLFVGYANQQDLDLDRFAQCLTNGEITRQVMLEKREGTSKQVKATPTFFIEGDRYVGWVALKNDGGKKIRTMLGLPPLEENEPEDAGMQEKESESKVQI